MSTLLSMVGQFSGVISLNVPTWLAGVSSHISSSSAIYELLTDQLAWGFTLKGATKIQIINEAVGLVFNCSEEEIQSGECVAQSGEQLYVDSLQRNGHRKEHDG